MLLGGGSENVPADKYYEIMMLYAFKCLVIVCREELLDVEILVAREAIRRNQKVIFVYSRVDRIVTSRLNDRDETYEQAWPIVRRKIKEGLKRDLAKIGADDRGLFIVSAWSFLDKSKFQHDEELLMEQIFFV